MRRCTSSSIRDQRLSFGTVLYNNDFAANSYNQSVRSDIFTANYAYRPDNSLIDFRANFYGSKLTMEYLSPAAGLSAASNTASGRQIEDTGLGFDVANISRIDLGAGVRVKSEYGYEYFHDDVDASNKLDSFSGGRHQSLRVDRILAECSHRRHSPRASSTPSSACVTTPYNLDGGGFVPTLGTPVFPGGPTPVLPSFLKPGSYSFNQSDGDFSPKLTLAAKPVEWFQPYVTYSESFRAPTISESLGGWHPSR